ncbi:MAG TPA: hypothetical protein VFW71_04955 [Actinomycetota bacterium]|nr:hypothetical protein [Actinomycetota bacterium]
MGTELTPRLLADLNVAMNESRLHDVTVRADRGEAAVLLSVLTLPEAGPEPEDPRLLLLLSGVARVAASLRPGHWNDEGAPAEPLELDQLGDVVSSFGGQPIYGWEFLDSRSSWDHWRGRFSLDVHLGACEGLHVLDLFQESLGGPLRHLDLRIWFQRLAAFDYDWRPRDLTEVAAGGRRWWEAFNQGDPRTRGHRMVPAGEWKLPSATKGTQPR